MNARGLMLSAVAVWAGVVSAATNTWTGAVNDWNWNEGGNYEKGLPSGGDVVLMPASADIRLIGSDTASLAVFNSLERVIPISSNTVLRVETDAENPVTLETAVSWPVSHEADAEAGYGEVVKTGPGTLTLANADRMAYCTSFAVREGVLRLPSTAVSGEAYPYSRLSVSNGATLFTVGSGGYTYVRELLGPGLVTNDSSRECYLQIWGGTREAPVRVEAKLTPMVRYYSPGVVDVLSEENTMAATFSVRRRSRSSDSMTGLAKFGNAGAVGSPGIGDTLFFMEFGGGFRYLGQGEKTTKSLVFANQDAHYGFGELDGGPYGGLELAGSVTARFGIRNLLLSGTNATPCVLSGKIQVASASPTNFVTISKRGSGIWRLASNGQRAGLAGVSVEEGTLQVDSVMEAGEWCSLGPATNRYSAGYCGPADAGKEVGYSIALGSAGSAGIPLFELVGTNGAWSSKRGIALFGDARILNSATNAANDPLPMRLSGISAGIAGTKTLFLEGDRDGTEDCVSGISDGQGRVAVVKTGSGKWSISGENTFTGGLTVSNGTLEVISPSGVYTWYRWNVKKTKNGGAETRAVEFGLYDADGARVNGGLSLCPLYSAIRRGEAAVQRQMTDYYGAGESTRELYNLFDDKTTGWDFFTPWKTGSTVIPSETDSDTWYRVLMRLPEGAGPVASYDVVANGASGYTPVVWSLEASVDGMTWDVVDSVVGNPFPQSANQWAFARPAAYSEGGAVNHAGGRAIVGSTNKTVCAISPDCPVSVAPGATLRCKGTAEIANLSVDCAGAGTISGFRFATDGVLDVRNLPEGGGVLPVTFENTDADETARIAGWTLHKDGAPTALCRISLSGGKLRVLPVGTVIVFR